MIEASIDAPSGQTRDAPSAPPSAPTPPRSAGFSPSTFVPALVELVASPLTGGTTGLELPRSPHRGRYLAVAATLVVGVIAATIVVATRDRRPTPPIVSAKAIPSTSVAADAVVVDAGSPDAVVASAPVDAASARPVVRVVGDRAPTPTPTPTPTPINEHVRNAEDARRAGSRLRQVAEADLALQAEPKNSRAKFLLGDALIATGDLDRGCKYLRALGRYAAAKARADAAGCP